MLYLSTLNIGLLRAKIKPNKNFLLFVVNFSKQFRTNSVFLVLGDNDWVQELLTARKYYCYIQSKVATRIQKGQST